MKSILKVRIEKQGRTLFDQIFYKDGFVTTGINVSNSIWLPFAWLGDQTKLAKISGKHVWVYVYPNQSIDIHMGQKIMTVAELNSLGLIKKKGQAIVLREGMNIVLDYGPIKLRLWLGEQSDVPQFSSSKFLGFFKEELSFHSAIFVLVSVLLHVMVMLVALNIYEPGKKEEVEYTEHFSKISIADQKDLVEKLNRAEQEQTPKSSKTSTRVSQKTIQEFQGFLQAVVSQSPGKKTTGFEKLFTTSKLTQDLEKALADNSLGNLLAKQGQVRMGFENENLKTLESGQVGLSKEDQEINSKLGARLGQGQIANLNPQVSQGGGHLNQDVLIEVLSSKTGQLQSCYEKALSKDKGIKGKMVLSMLIDQDGRPKNLQIVENSTRDKTMEACVLEKARAWVFPKPKGGEVPVRFPFIFTS